MQILYTTWVWVFGLLVTPVFGSLAILTSWIPPRGRVYQYWARWWSRTLAWGAGLEVRVEAGLRGGCLGHGRDCTGRTGRLAPRCSSSTRCGCGSSGWW